MKLALSRCNTSFGQRLSRAEMRPMRCEKDRVATVRQNSGRQIRALSNEQIRKRQARQDVKPGEA